MRGYRINRGSLARAGAGVLCITGDSKVLRQPRGRRGRGLVAGRDQGSADARQEAALGLAGGSSVLAPVGAAQVEAW